MVFKFVTTFFINCLRYGGGKIPNHLAFVMDGNRRFAKQNELSSVTDGHTIGYERLLDVLEWCVQLGVRNVSAYAFSIENFKRPKEEIDALFDLAKKRFSSLLDHDTLIQRFKIRIIIVGNLDLLPPELVKVMNTVVQKTAHHNGPTLYVCFSYTSRYEISHAMELYIQKEKPFSLSIPFPDIWIRTSGAHRLSDYLTWQSKGSLLFFTSVLWPCFGFWYLLMVIWTFQFSKS